MTNDNVEVPIMLEKTESGLYVVSFILPRVHFKEPFFVDSLAKYFPVIKSQIKLPEEDEPLARPFIYDTNDSRVVITPVDEFIKKHNQTMNEDRLGFIFHMSRCGSTLVSQMLASNNSFFVLSEPGIINSILDPAYDIKLSTRLALLRASISSLIACSPHECKIFFIKFRSWNVFYLNLILKEFSNVKWIFIHRHGLEVLSSVFEKPPGWLRSRISYAKYFSQIVGVDSQTLKQMSVDEFSARVLGTFCRTAIKNKSKNAKYIDYVNIVENFFEVCTKHWGLNLSEIEKREMINITKLYSKDVNKEKPFTSDSLLKTSQASKIQIDLVSKFVEVERSNLINK